MRSFADLLETTAAAPATTDARSLTTVAGVKLALKISGTDSDALIAALIPRVSALVVDHCRLARDGAGAVPTFGRETLRATWYAESGACRGADLYLPWRAPVYSLDSVVEDGTTLTVGTDVVLPGAIGGRLRRLSGDAPAGWSGGKIVVTWKAGFALTTSLAANIDATIETAAIEQVKAMLLGADRDPAIRSESAPDLAAVSYTVPGGDAQGGAVLLPTVRDMLAPWRNPAP